MQDGAKDLPDEDEDENKVKMKIGNHDGNIGSSEIVDPLTRPLLIP